MAALFGPDNPNWKGGSWINSGGYVMVWVGKGHPMATCRAYAPLHRLICFEVYGPPPTPDMHAHHKDEDKMNNAPDNLEWRTPTDHGRLHLTPDRARKLGAKGGRAAARLRRRLKRQQEEARKARKRRKAA